MNSNQHQRKSLFHHQGARSVARSTRSRTNQASLYRISAGGLAAAAAAAAANNPNHHPAPMQNNNNFNEMSQISQLSMDSSFGNSQSQSTVTNGNNFVDGIPLRQPSASMTMTSHSSASSSGHQQRYLYQPNKNHVPSFDFHNGGNMGTTNSSNCIQKNSSNNVLSSGDHQIKSSLQKKKKTKRQKTRFSNAVDHSDGGSGTHSMSQGSYSPSYASSTSTSHSASKSSNGSHRSHHSGNGRQVATNTTYDHHQARKQQQQQQQQHIATLNNRGGIGGRSLLTRSGTNYSRVLLTRECRNNQRSSPIPLLQDPTFAKAATPRKRCNVPYPPLESELKHQHELLLQQQQHLKQQQQQQQQIHEHRVGITTATMASSNMAEERDQESYTSRRNEEKDEKDVDNDNNLHDTGSTGNTNQHHHGHRGKENEKHLALLDSTIETKVDPTTTTDSNDGDVSGRFSSHQHTTAAGANTTDSLVSVERTRQRLLSEVECLEVRKKQDMEEIENRLVMEIQKQLEEKKLELFTQMQSKVETATSDAEGKLNQKAIAILEVTTSKLDQKHDDIEKKMTATASTLLEKLEVSIEEGCAKISNFTGTLINNIKPILNASLSSLHFSSSSSSEKETPKKRDAAIGPVVGEQQRRKKRRFEDASLDRGRLEDTSTSRESPGRSQKKDTVANSSSSTIFEGAVSLTQGSRQSGVDKASVRSRRSKRERKDDNGAVENNHPVTKAKRVKKVSKNETKDKKDCPSHTQNKKKKKKTMVTPPASKFRSRRKKKGGNQKVKVAIAPATKKQASDRTDSPSSAKVTAVVPIVATTTDRKAKVEQADRKKDRKSGSKRGKIPSEIIMTSDWELSPYQENSFESSKSNIKPPSVSSSVTKKRNTKKSFSKRKSTDPLLSPSIN